MKKAIKFTAMVLCMASFMTFMSCDPSPDPTPDTPNSSRDAGKLVGEWKCTWSSGLSEMNIQENAYVGAVWKFGTPVVAPNDNCHYLGDFNVAVDGSYPEDAFGEFHFWIGDQYWLPRLTVWTSAYNDFYIFNGYHEVRSQRGGDATRIEGDYSIVLTDNTMTLYQFDNSVDNINDAKLLLKFEKLQR